jgi:hypothetical protein
LNFDENDFSDTLFLLLDGFCGDILNIFPVEIILNKQPIFSISVAMVTTNIIFYFSLF